MPEIHLLYIAIYQRLADLAGLHRTYIGQVEGGKRNITIVNLFRIATALEIEAYLFLIEDSFDSKIKPKRSVK